MVRYASIASANVANVSAGVAGVAAADTSSKFGAVHAGNYYYAVAGVNKAGESTLAKSAQVAVAAGDKVTLTIQPSAGGTETGYAVYRSALNGGNANGDFRLMCRVAKAAGGGNTTYVDLNRDIPGTSKAYILNLSPATTR